VLDLPSSDVPAIAALGLEAHEVSLRGRSDESFNAKARARALALAR
jgi:hypothetical protein